MTFEVGPEQVGLDRAALQHERRVDRGALDTGVLEKVEREVLELAAGGDGAVGDERSEGRCAAVAGVAGEDVGELADAEALLGERLAHDAP